MRTLLTIRRTFLTVALVAMTTPLGCSPEGAEQVAPPAQEPKAAESKKAPLGRNVWLETIGDRRRVVLEARVCLREGLLEQFLCRKHTKEHEAILTADVDAREVHAALLVAGAKPGSPVQFQPRYQPAHGTRIKVLLQYDDKGKSVTVPAQKWIRNVGTGKDLAHEWVFAGSQLIPNTEDKNQPPYYAANSGDLICISNFESAMLDLPINSSRENAELAFEANAERIPPLDTRVTVILEPGPEAKKPAER